MARVTIEDCLEVVGNRFAMIAIAAKRARQIALGDADPLVSIDNDKPTVVALREIAQGYTEFDSRADHGDFEFSFDEVEEADVEVASEEAVAAEAEDTEVAVDAATEDSDQGAADANQEGQADD